MSHRPSGFRSKGHGDDRRIYPIFDTSTIGRPLRSSRFVHPSREALHQTRAAQVDREMQEQAYAQYVAKGLHGQGDVVVVSTPARTTSLKLTTVKTEDVRFREERPYNLKERSAYFEDQIKQGKTVPPILVHKLPDGKYQVLDGHARLQAYRNMGIKEVPAVENSIGEVLGKIGKGIASGARSLGRAAKAGYRAAKPVVVKTAKLGAKTARVGAKATIQVAKYGKTTLGKVISTYEGAARIKRIQELARKGSIPAQEYLLEHGHEW